MAKFDAATAVEDLEYDFTKYGGGAGVIPEPSTGAVNQFFAQMRILLNEAKGLMPNAEQNEEMSPEEMAETLEGMDDTMAKAAEFQGRSAAAISALCSGEPSTEDLEKLPLRVSREFTKWLVRQINPKAEEGPNNVQVLPAPQDRRPATKSSSKGKR